MATSEIVFNEYLAAELRKRYKSWQAEDIIRCENTETLAGFTAHRPDLVVRDNPMAPVSIETEFSPAATVETDAAARLYQPTGGTIHSAIAVRIPAKYRKFSGKRIASALEDEHTLEYCLIYGDSAATRRRWPSAGYLQGSVTDIAYVIETARVSPITVDQGATILENGANMLAAMLESISIKNQKLRTSLSDSLKQEASLQTYIMASTILVNAFVFQDTIAGTSDDLSSIASLSELGTHPAKNDVIAAWDAVLNVNYWPIFGVAKALLKAVPAPIWGDFMQCCLGIADRLLSLNLGKNPDLIGTIFQRLISDRRFLATFYTAPSSAALMARFVTRASGSGEVDWSNIDIVKSLKVADFACGTGILLCALYSEMRTCMEHAGIDSKSVHQWMVENSLFGCDVIPSATHITATQLSSVFPMVRYNETKVLTMPFGRTNAGDVALGSIDLLEKQSVMPTIATHAVGIRAQSEVQVDAWKAVGGT